MLHAPFLRQIALGPGHSLEPEWMDGSEAPPAVLAGNLRDLRRVNRWLGGIRLTRLGIEQLLGANHRDPVVIADIGAGCGDIPVAIARRLTTRGIPATALAFDVS